MAEDAVIHLRAIDETGAPLKRVVANMRQAQDAMRNMLGATRREYDEQGRAAERAGRRVEDSHRRAARAARQHHDAMASMIGNYARAALSFETARRAMLGFADQDERLRRLQNQAGATTQEMEKLSPALRNLARSSGQSVEELTNAFNDFRDSLELSVTDAQKVFPAIARGALAAGVPVQDMSNVIVRTMLNMKVAGKDIPRIIDQWVKAGEDHHIQINRIAASLPKLTEVMGEWGYKGTRGNAAMLAWLASLHSVTGSTEEAEEALSALFEAMTNPSVADKLGHTPDSLEAGLRRAAKAGKDPLSVFLAMIKQQERFGQSVETIFTKPALRRYVRTLLDGLDEVPKKVNDIDNSLGRANKSAGNMERGPKHAINVLTAGVIELRDAFGGVLAALGAVSALKGAAGELENLTKAFTAVTQALKTLDEVIETGNLSKLKDILSLADWRSLLGVPFSPMTRLAPLAEKITSAATRSRIAGAAEAEYKATGQLPRITLGDVRSSIGGGGEQLPKSALGMLWDQLNQKRELTEEERKATEQLNKLNESGDALDQTLKKMRFDLESGGGPGGAKVWKASYGGGPGGVGGARGYGGGPGGFGPGGVPYAGGGRFGGAGLGMLRDRMMGGGGGPGGGGPGGGGPGGGGPGGGGPSGPGETPGSFANVRTNNPGAQSFSQRAAELFGATPQTTGAGHPIAAFPSPVHGAASNMDLFARNYTGMRLGDAIRKWSGGGRGAPKGYDPNMIVTPEMMRDPDFAIPLMKTIAAGEAPGKYPMDDAQWAQAHKWALQGGARGEQALGRAPSGAPFASGSGSRVEQVQSREAGTRKGAIDPRLEEALHAAAEKTGLRVRVTSGGQRMPGAPESLGSPRHDQGKAADFDLLDENGNKLAIDNPRRLQFLEEMAAAGAGGAGMGYMRDSLKIHGGITGSEGVAGRGLRPYAGSRAEREAIIRGVDRMNRERPVWERSPEERALARGGRDAQTIPSSASQGDTWGRGARPAPYMDDRGGAIGQFSSAGDRGGGRDTSYDEDTPPSRSSGVEDAMRARQELERPIKVNMDMGGATQFGRASMRREADREVREARFNSTMDIGAA